MKDTLSFPNIFVALDLSEMDEQLVAYTRFMAGIAGTRSISFVHVIPQFIFPEPVGSAFDESIRGEEPLKQRIRRQLAQEIQPLVDDLKGVDIRIEVLEGKPQEQLLHYAHANQPDLLILGKKALSGDSGIIARRIARKVHCALCFVTEETTTELQRLLVSVDFSEASGRALQFAAALKAKFDQIRITALHVIEVPRTAYRININTMARISQMEQEAAENFRIFLKEQGLAEKEVRLKTAINEEFDISKYICKAGEEEDADLIIVGAKGYSPLDDVIFGSVTEKLVSREGDIPILVIR